MYFAGGQAQAEGVLLAVTSGGIGVGIVMLGQGRTMPEEEVTEERGRLGVDRGRRSRAFTPTSRRASRRRHAGAAGCCSASAGAAFAALGAALLFPIRSLGPRPGRDLKRTPYADAPAHPGRAARTASRCGPTTSRSTASSPCGPRGTPTPPTRRRCSSARAPAATFEARDGREDWTVDGVVAYSKLCTHVGCPVGLYQAEEGLLLCPCHQSTFDVYDGARPVFGPAARSLPQLPLAVDDDGLPHRHRRLHRPRRPRLLGPGPVS